MLMSAVPAYGVTLAEKQAEAAAIKAQVDELDAQLEIAAEDYNEAKAAYDEVTAQIAENEERLAALEARQTELEGHLATRVEGMYRQGAIGYLEVLFEAKSFEEFATVWNVLQTLNTSDASNVAELKDTRADVEQVTQALAEQQAQAKVQSDTLKAKQDAIEGQLAEREGMLAGVQADIQSIIEEQRRAEEAAAAARAAAAAAARNANESYDPPSGAAHGDVVAVAMTKLGCRYVWAAAGPDTFDCSGFTMWCYRQIGISLPHSSRAQINCGERVSYADLEPGDLVFFGSPIHHVGMYVGNGQFIHAPRTGDVVKISNLASRSDYAGACRP